MKAEAASLTQWALWAGQHALPIFLALLGFLLASTVACWWARRRYTAPPWQANSAQAGSIGPRIAVGVATILAGAAVFAALAAQLAPGKELGLADQAFIDGLRAGVPPLALHVFAALTHLGDAATRSGLCIVMAIALIAYGRRWLAFGWVIAVAGNGLLTQFLKQIFGRARPPHLDGLVLEQGFSFPSGHSSGSVVAYGMLAYLSLRLLPARWHLPALVAAVALAFAVGASRVFLRVHFASDVIAGFATGVSCLAACIMAIETIRWHHQQSRMPQAATGR